jgi:Mg-chelatase subunit ChlD
MRRWGLMSNHFLRRVSFLVVAVGVGACHASAVHPGPSNSNRSNGTGGTGGVGPGSGSDGAPMLMLPDAGATMTATPTASAATCATQMHVAERAPVDLLLLVDTSSSMGERSGTQTKWDKARDSLRAFVSDPASAGLGVGMMFFPTSGADARQACQQASDCTSVSPAMPTTGSPCLLGVCQSFDDGCRVDHFGKPDVDVGDLPAQAGAITTALALRAPNGATPMVLAVDSAFAALRARQIAFPNRRQALVLSTDGLPSGCGLTQSVAAVVDRISGAQAATPAIPTYVVGVFTPEEINMAQPTLQMFAQRGGTGMPFLLSTGDDLNQKLLAALQKIRGLVVACEYTIPAPSMGALDFGKVNVRTTSQGTTAELAYVTSADKCSADKGGWYYDHLPASGMPPSRVIICPASCTRLSSDSGAQVELVFGCATRRID